MHRKISWGEGNKRPVIHNKEFTPEELLDKGDQLFRSGKMADAEKCYKQSAAKDFKQAYITVVNFYLGQNMYAEVLYYTALAVNKEVEGAKEALAVYASRYIKKGTDAKLASACESFVELQDDKQKVPHNESSLATIIQIDNIMKHSKAAIENQLDDSARTTPEPQCPRAPKKRRCQHGIATKEQAQQLQGIHRRLQRQL